MVYINKLSQELKDEIVRCYTDTRLTTTEICEMYNLSTGTFNRIISMSGVARRNPDRVGTKYSKHKITYKSCSYCGTKALSENSKFCHICGKPLCTYKEQILKDLQKLTKYSNSIDVENRLKFINSIQDLKKRIKKLRED